MAHYAELDETNTVLRVLVVADSDEPTEAAGQQFLANLLGGHAWRKTSYNTQAGVHTGGGTPFRKNYAGIGYKYDEGRDAFVPPQPYPSWTLEEDTCQWQAPVAMPTPPDENTYYVWDEDMVNWRAETRTP